MYVTHANVLKDTNSPILDLVVSRMPLLNLFSVMLGVLQKIPLVERTIMLASFDDFNKFTWIYLLKHRSKVFGIFLEFQKLVERHFDRKILIV